MRGIRDIHLPHAEVLGEDTGNGEELARFILGHYNSLPSRLSGKDGDDDGSRKLPLLFLVGEQRRDVIPRILQRDDAEATPDEERVEVHESVVYETRVMESFEEEFRGAVRAFVDGVDGEGDVAHVLWVVVFSPTGCDAMLRVLGFEPGTGSKRFPGLRPGKEIYVATIGPTTGDHLRTKYGFEPDVVSNKPSPEGLGRGIEEFMAKRCVDGIDS